MASPLPVRIWRESQPRFLSILRIMAAFVFIQYGTAKLFAWPVAMGPHGPVALMSQMGLAGVLETFGGGLLLVGLFTRPLAFLLCGEMAVAYFQNHVPRGFWPLANGGVPPVLFCFIWLYISAAGPGPWSLDALLRRTEASR